VGGPKFGLAAKGRKTLALGGPKFGLAAIRKYCNQALVLKNGRGRVFSDVDFAIKIYQSLQWHYDANARRRDRRASIHG
jgi:hypothetical protein